MKKLALFWAKPSIAIRQLIAWAPNHFFGVTMGRGISAGLNLLISLLLIRVLSQEDYGNYFFYYTILSFCVSVPGLAINKGFVYCYQNSDNPKALLSTFTFIKAALVLFASALAGVLFFKGLISKFLTIAVIAGFLLSFFETATCLSQAQRRFKVFAALMPIRNLMFIFMLGLAYLGADPFSLGAAMIALLGSSIALAGFSVFMARGFRLEAFSLSSLFELLTAGARFVAFELSAVIQPYIQVWVLGYFTASEVLNATDLAEYGAGFTFAFLFPIISSSVTSVLITEIKHGDSLGPAGVRRLVVASGVILVLVLLYAAFSYQVAQFVAPEKYQELHWLIPTLCVGMYFSFCTNYMRIRMLAHDSDRFLNIVYGVQAILAVVVSYGLIGEFGLLGAVVAFVFVRAFALVLIGFRFVMDNYRYANDRGVE